MPRVVRAMPHRSRAFLLKNRTLCPELHQTEEGYVFRNHIVLLAQLNIDVTRSLSFQSDW